MADNNALDGYLLPLIRDSEGCRLSAYRDTGGIWTCGFGCTGKDIGPKTKWSRSYANAMLRIRASQALDDALRASPGLRNESAGKLTATADFIYNLGINNYLSSTLKKSIDAGNWGDAQRQIVRWNKARVDGELVVLPGLTARRAKEAALLG
jgi:GH24 family phage-related lysozyme (muramidase)